MDVDGKSFLHQFLIPYVIEVQKIPTSRPFNFVRVDQLLQLDLFAFFEKMKAFVSVYCFRYFILKSDGQLLGYKNKPVNISDPGEPCNNFTVKVCISYPLKCSHIVHLDSGLPDNDLRVPEAMRLRPARPLHEHRGGEDLPHRD